MEKAVEVVREEMGIYIETDTDWVLTAFYVWLVCKGIYVIVILRSVIHDKITTFYIKKQGTERALMVKLVILYFIE